MAEFIEVVGPNRSGEFIASLPTGETSVLVCWEDLEALEVVWGVEQVHGNLLNLSRRSRSDTCVATPGDDMPPT